MSETDNAPDGLARQFLRHAVATVAYRGAKALRDVPDGFENFRAAPDSRSAGEILGHLCDLYDWALGLANGERIWTGTVVEDWAVGRERFFEALGLFDERLAAADDLACTVERLLQGPVADSLTHIGQIAMLHRLAGGAVRGENYFVADIAVGTTGAQQPPPNREFD